MDQSAEIIIIQKDPDLSMASCGYPYYVGGFFDEALDHFPVGPARGVVSDRIDAELDELVAGEKEPRSGSDGDRVQMYF